METVKSHPGTTGTAASKGDTQVSAEDASVRAVHRTILVLNCMADLEDSISIRDLSLRVNLPRSTVQRLLASLQAEGLVHQHSDRASYRLGAGAYRLVAKINGRLNLRTQALPVMTRARDLSKQGVTLSIREGDHSVVIESVDGTALMRGFFRPGDRMPLYVGAAGKLTMSDLPEEEVDNIIASTGLEPLTPNTITDPGALKAELARIRQKGYSTSDGERYLGLYGLAAPVRDYTGRMVAALFLNGPRQEFVATRHNSMVKIVAEAADEISLRMGFGGKP
jgi:DNA-binding IclR family transcriptional regulator